MDQNAKAADDRPTTPGKDTAAQPIVIRKLDRLETTSGGRKSNPSGS
jgi:hypothetical protein